MTTAERYRGVEEIELRLADVWQRRWLVRLLAAAAAVGTVACGAVVLAAVALGYWPDQPPAAARWAVLLLGVGSLVFALVWFVGRAALWRQNPAQVARFAESRMPELRNDLINSVLLARERRVASPELVHAAITESVVHTRHHDLRRSVSLRPLRRWGGALAVAILLVGALAVFQPGPMRTGLLAAFDPTAFVPRRGTLELVKLEPGDVTVFVGETVSVVAKIRNPRHRPLEAVVVFENAPAQPMLAGDRHTTFTHPIENVQSSFRYAVRIGDDPPWPKHKRWYTVTVRDRIEFEGLDVRYAFPKYMHRGPEVVNNADGDLAAPMGSTATVTLRLGGPVPSAWLERPDAPARRMRRTDNGRRFQIDVPIEQDGRYRLVVRDARDQALQSWPNGNGGAWFIIKARPDGPPAIQCIEPNADAMVPVGGKLEVTFRATDAVGLHQAALYLAAKDQSEQQLRSWTLDGAKDRKITYTIDLAGRAEGDELTYYAAATDTRRLPAAPPARPRALGPQTAESDRFRITVQDPQKLQAERDKLYQRLNERLAAILQLQLAQRVNTDICWKQHKTLEQVRATAGEICTGQQAIRGALVTLLEDFPFDAALISVHQTLALLANQEARTAIDQARVVQRLEFLGPRDQTCAALAGTQDEIIDTLNTLLAVLPRLRDGAEGREATRPGGDIPPEVREKLRDLQQGLQEFQEAERKAIEAAERLTKKPVDDFTAADEELLKELKAVQDKWEKFLNEQFTDFSKMAQQDFSNPAMLKELMSVKNDVTMAKDALKKKAIEIATAIEDNGIENAKTLTANFEKWLPDKPDRIKWAMEDPAGGQENIEAPELPKELEDLVGDLLEQEEELFDEADDISSKYTLSGDKAIGWDAMDGPMPNMNAQGVTGNQLPNSSEMAGRSGEGRQGKSTGEFVEDKAVGKGGRRTPTRLTPEAFQKGQVDDSSKEPAGGATGGGKLSGAGAEGLEGPVPPPLQKRLRRLAGKQAALVNRAERIRAKFQPSDYRHFQLGEMVTLMNRVKTDLEQYRYQNVLRARDVTLRGMRKSALLLTGKVYVEEDASKAMPKYLRKEIDDVQEADFPVGYEDVLKEYYTRLSEGGQ